MKMTPLAITLIEGSFRPHTRRKWWLDRSGNRIGGDGEDDDHAELVKEHFKLLKIADWKALKTGFEAGWVRCASGEITSGGYICMS